MTHTPIPWKVYDLDRRTIVGTDGDAVIADVRSWAVADDAAFIVRACNSHQMLLDALKEAMSAVQTFHGPEAWEIYRDHSPEMQRWCAAIKAAEEA